MEVVGVKRIDDKVRIEVLNTFKDLQNGDKYFVIKDLIISPPCFNHRGPFKLSDPTWCISGLHVYMNNFVLQWYNGYNLKEDEITWWLILKSTCWL